MKFLIYLSLLVLISACASAPPPKHTPVKPKAKEPVAKVYSFEPPVVPEPEEVTPSTTTPGGREAGGIHGQNGVAVLGVTRAGVAVNLVPIPREAGFSELLGELVSTVLGGNGAAGGHIP